MNPKILKIPGLLLITALLLAACSPSAAPPPAMPEKETAPAAEMMKEETPMASSPETIMENSESQMAWPAWTTTEVVNVNNGETFKVADFQGKVILVETLAMWCSNCMKQQQQVKALHEKLADRSDFVSIGLGIDINENLEDLQQYASKNGFDWVYTVATKEMAQEIGSTYGNQFLNPPSTPILLIDKQGEVHILPFGIKSADDLEAAILPLLEPAS